MGGVELELVGAWSTLNGGRYHRQLPDMAMSVSFLIFPWLLGSSKLNETKCSVYVWSVSATLL